MKRQSGKLRIIGGQHRGQKITFMQADGLRPTPDRLRETLFNWLAREIEGCLCLDLYAGSGALGFEALSRGAAKVIFLESNRQAANSINTHLKNLAHANSQVICDDALLFLDRTRLKADIVFLDPPFQSALLQKSVAMLERGELLNQGGWVYIEAASHDPPLSVTANWHLHRSTTVGDVRGSLYKVARR